MIWKQAKAELAVHQMSAVVSAHVQKDFRNGAISSQLEATSKGYSTRTHTDYDI